MGMVHVYSHIVPWYVEYSMGAKQSSVELGKSRVTTATGEECCAVKQGIQVHRRLKVLIKW